MSKLEDEDIEAALASLSRIITRYGDIYWPLFERLEAELHSRNSKTARLNRYSEKPMTPIVSEEAQRFSASGRWSR